ncbi:unnamed protein product [Gongylonema pulchrum]|uniref:ZP domain-containing protein n=1 Tax=Gongylonema pulchrum TaxID=637853 RepID=A0A183EAZ5_9BILA|nr:unnamed protein product [Gongylonema pulchrum]
MLCLVVYVVRVSSSAAVDARIGHCWARDERSTLQLSDDNGCSLQRVGEVWNEFQRNEQGTDIIFRNQIKAWAFPTSSDVSIFCNLHMCRFACRHLPCAGGERQRRDAATVVPADSFSAAQVLRTNYRVENGRKKQVT